MVEAAPIRKCHLNNYYTIKVGREYKPWARKPPCVSLARAGTNDDGPHNPALTMSIMTLTAQTAVLQCHSLYYLETYSPCLLCARGENIGGWAVLSVTAGGPSHLRHLDDGYK